MGLSRRTTARESLQIFSVGQAIYFNLSFFPIIKKKRSSQSAFQVGDFVRLLCAVNSQSGTNKVAKTRETNYISNDIAVVYICNTMDRVHSATQSVSMVAYCKSNM